MSRRTVESGGANIQPRPKLPFCKAAHLDSHLMKSDLTCPLGSTWSSASRRNGRASSASALLRLGIASTGHLVRPVPALPVVRVLASRTAPQACSIRVIFRPGERIPHSSHGMCDSSHCDKKALFHRGASGDEVMKRSSAKADRISQSSVGITDVRASESSA